MHEPTAETSYLFRHALVHEAAYELQMPADRATLHAMVVNVFEDVLAEDDTLLDAVALEIADHAKAAAQLPAQSEHFLAREMKFLARAFDHAKRRYAHSLAANLGTRMLSHTALRREQVSELARNVGVAHMHMGEMGVAAGYFRQAAESAASDRERGRALVAEADMYRNMAQHAEAERLFGEALENLTPADGADYAEALRQLSATFLMQGRLHDGEPVLLKALEASRACGDHTGSARCEVNLGVVKMHTGDPQEAERAFLNARELAESVDDLTTAALAKENLGALLAHTGRLQEAEQHFRQALEEAQSAGDRPLLASILTNLGQGLTDAERYEEAEAIMRDALALHHENQNLSKQAATLGNLAVLCFRTGRKDEGLRLTRESIELNREAGARHSECVGHLNLSDTLFNDGSYDAALGELEIAEGILSQLPDPRLQGSAACQRVMIEAARDRTIPDAAAWRRGIELIRRSGDTRAVDRLQSELAERFPERA